ncbi:MAG TPA: VOC family protein [Candidatus Latescibacteria bacterium]|nr:VOC family protein [Candidatus Latescibacterota bacterium]
MPNYTFQHIHHEATEVQAAVDFYQRVFDATADEPFERGGATWVAVHISGVQVTVTDREFSGMDLGRYQGLDHFALTSDDVDATMARLEETDTAIWAGPLQLENGQRIVFINGPDHVKIEIMEMV